MKINLNKAENGEDSVRLGKDFFVAARDNDIKTFIKLSRSDLPLSIINYVNKGLNSPLIIASQIKKQSESLFIVNSLLSFAGVNVNIQNTEGMTALMFAAQTSNHDVVVALLNAGADFELSSSNNTTAWDMSTDETVKETLSQALKSKQDRLHRERVEMLYLSLIESVAEGDQAKVQYMVDSIPPGEIFNHYSAESPSALLIAFRRMDCAMVRLLLAAGARADSAATHDQQNRNFLMLTSLKNRLSSYPHTQRSREAEAGRLEMLQCFLGPDVDREALHETDSDGLTPLMIACLSGYEEDASLLLDALRIDPLPMGDLVDRRQQSSYVYRGGPSYRYKHGDTAALLSARQGRLAILRLLAAHGADLNAQGFGGMTALMWAVFRHDVPMVEFVLLRAATSLNCRTDTGKTALFLAIEEGRLELAMKLMKFNCVLDHDYAEYWPPLSPAAAAGDMPVVSVSMSTTGGATPLMALCRCRRYDSPADALAVHALVLLLMRRGADINSQAVSGETALQIAATLERIALVKLLLQLGAISTKHEKLKPRRGGAECIKPVKNRSIVAQNIRNLLNDAAALTG